MGIQLTNIRISNFRSIDYCDIELNDLNVIIGQNNVGKSNVLRAITIALNSTYSVSESDIRVEKGEELSVSKQAIIDIMIRPTDDEGKISDTFSPFWISTFSDRWVSTDSQGSSFVGIRTTIYYDAGFGQYGTQKSPILQWNDTLNDAVCDRHRTFTQDMQSYICCFYMDAHRDIIEDIKNKKSFFGRATSEKDLPEAIIKDIEKDLNEINSKIVANTPALNSTQMVISEIGNIIGNRTQLQIEPISRKISDLHRGMDVKLAESDSASLSISEQGMGTRSWTSFLTLGAYIINLTKQIKVQDPEAEIFTVLTLEEPEAHLHSHAQKGLFEQILRFPGQKIISTHSSNIVACTPIECLIHLYKNNAQTKVHKVNRSQYSSEDIGIIQREITRSRGDLLFSSAVILAEGITEESALPIFFKQYFGREAFSAGVSIVGIDGQRYKAFLRLLKDFDIPWFIFSDGETSTINTVKKAVENVYGQKCQEMNNVVFLNPEDNFETNLVNSGYVEEMISAVNKYEKVLREELYPEDAAHDPTDFFDRYIGRYKNRNYSGTEGRKQAIIDICKNNGGKAKYAAPIAQEITEYSAKKTPEKIEELFKIIDIRLMIKGDECGGD